MLEIVVVVAGRVELVVVLAIVVVGTVVAAATVVEVSSALSPPHAPRTSTIAAIGSSGDDLLISLLVRRITAIARGAAVPSTQFDGYNPSPFRIPYFMAEAGDHPTYGTAGLPLRIGGRDTQCPQPRRAFR
jgi:hypothetical protein